MRRFGRSRTVTSGSRRGSTRPTTSGSAISGAAALSTSFRLHALDLPRFGSSSKPALGAYNARWFAGIMLGLMDELDIGSAYLVGNSLGGRVAIEVALIAPSARAH